MYIHFFTPQCLADTESNAMLSNLTINVTSDKEIMSCNNITRLRTVEKMTNENHSKLEEIKETTDLDRCSISERLRCPHASEYDSNKENVHGRESIMRKRVVDKYGDAKRAANLKFKLYVWTGALGRTMGVRVSAGACLALLLALLASGAAAPAPTRPRPTRSTHHEKFVVTSSRNLSRLLHTNKSPSILTSNSEA
ncbi:hypothetical protein ACJJTC_015334 [Scirpophaga incertulas]